VSRTRRCRGGPAGERGSALVEVFFLGILMLLPIVYLMLSAFAVQRAAYGVTQAAREAGRIFTVTGDAGRATAAARLAMADQGVAPATAAVAICPGDAGCFRPGGDVEVVVSTTVPLPFVPSFLAGAVNAAIPVSGRHVGTVDEFRQLS
jgi:hypothetical protein